MGLLDDYGIDADEIEDVNYDVPDGVYRFEVGNVVNWESDDGDRQAIRFDFLLDDEEGTTGQKGDWFNMPEDPHNPTDYEKQTLSRLKSRIISLGIPAEDAGTVAAEDMIGITGTLQLVSVAGKGKNKGKTFQNIRNVRADSADDAPAEEPEEKPRRTPAKSAPVGKAAGAKKNPFAAK